MRSAFMGRISALIKGLKGLACLFCLSAFHHVRTQYLSSLEDAAARYHLGSRE